MTRREIKARLAPWLQRWSLPDQEPDERWLESLWLQNFATGDYLVRSGDRNDTLYFLADGLVRLFYITLDGRERNKAFYRAGQATGPLSAAITGSPAPFSIQSLEPVEAVCCPFSALREAAILDAPLASLYQTALEEAFIRNEQREAMLLTCNAEQRYQWLLEREPDLPDRVAQFHLASYLGIDPVTLSRLKRKYRDGVRSGH